MMEGTMEYAKGWDFVGEADNIHRKRFGVFMEKVMEKARKYRGVGEKRLERKRWSHGDGAEFSVEVRE